MCLTISGKKVKCFCFKATHLECIYFDFHSWRLRHVSHADPEKCRRQEEPTERTFDELLDHVEASLMQARWRADFLDAG